MRPRPIAPKPGQESVWDYPRPPRVEPVHGRVVVEFGGRIIAESVSALRVLETSHPPGVYVPISDWVPGALRQAEGSSWCEFKGRAAYWDVVAGDAVAERAAWGYPAPSRGFEQLAEFVSVYPGRMDRCSIDGETVQPQEGTFYGGWITSDIVGPFKGAAGTMGW